MLYPITTTLASPKRPFLYHIRYLIGVDSISGTLDIAFLDDRHAILFCGWSLILVLCLFIPFVIVSVTKLTGSRDHHRSTPLEMSVRGYLD